MGEAMRVPGIIKKTCRGFTRTDADFPDSEIKKSAVFRRTSAAAFVFLAAVFGISAKGLPGLQWRRGPETLALLKDGAAVWQFDYASTRSKPYFHPVCLPDGSPLTWLSPKDHPHHFALFFSWKYLNHVNYWEEPGGAPEGLTRWSDVRIDPRADYSARFAMNLQYRPRGGTADILTERRSIEISAPGKDGAYAMDWTMVFTAGNDDVVLDRTPPDTKPDGNPRGGYAGLSVRLARELTKPNITATAPTGAVANSRYGFAAAAAEFSGTIDGGDAGMAFFDHPANPRYPTRWYGIMDGSVPFWYLNASLLQMDSYTLPKGKTLTLRYRVAIHPGRWDAARLQKEHAIYSKTR
jgi:hypothetical protein